MDHFKSSDFRDRSTEFFGKWVHDRKFDMGTLGQFEVALVTEGKSRVFDREMLEFASRLVDFTSAAKRKFATCCLPTTGAC